MWLGSRRKDKEVMVWWKNSRLNPSKKCLQDLRLTESSRSKANATTAQCMCMWIQTYKNQLDYSKMLVICQPSVGFRLMGLSDYPHPPACTMSYCWWKKLKKSCTMRDVKKTLHIMGWTTDLNWSAGFLNHQQYVHFCFATLAVLQGAGPFTVPLHQNPALECWWLGWVYPLKRHHMCEFHVGQA